MRKLLLSAFLKAIAFLMLLLALCPIGVQKGETPIIDIDFLLVALIVLFATFLILEKTKNERKKND